MRNLDSASAIYFKHIDYFLRLYSHVNIVLFNIYVDINFENLKSHISLESKFKSFNFISILNFYIFNLCRHLKLSSTTTLYHRLYINKIISKSQQLKSSKFKYHNHNQIKIFMFF